MPLWLIRFGPYLAIVAAGLGLWLYVATLQHRVADLRATTVTLSRDLKVEQAARRRDVAGLTTLAQGLATVVTDTKRDRAILTETINATNPAPASPGLAKLLAGLREADGQQHAPAAGPGGASASPARGPDGR